jgi:hypothetical protein
MISHGIGLEVKVVSYSMPAEYEIQTLIDNYEGKSGGIKA